MIAITDSPKRKHHWYQFNLQTLLIVMLVSCVALGGWIQFRRQRARQNRLRVAGIEEAVAAIEKLGGTVTFENEEVRAQTWLERQFDDPGGKDDPVDVLKVTGVDFSDTNVTDAGLRHLTGMIHLKNLSLSFTKVTDAGLRYLSGLRSLQSLDLWDTKVTIAGFALHLNGMTDLQYLGLGRTKVTDSGLKYLERLKNLQSLNLAHTSVTNRGLEHLKGMTNLQNLYIYNTNVTDEGGKKLQQALPNCNIFRLPLLLPINSWR